MGAGATPPKERHLIAYVQTSKLTDWKRLALLHRKQAGRPVFVYRSDDDQNFAKYATPGAVLWVIESHPGRPPSLAARLDIVGRIHGRLEVEVLKAVGRAGVSPELLRSFEYGRKLRWYAVGAPRKSRFYGYNDISRPLLATRLQGGQRWKPGATQWQPGFGRTFLRPRLIASGQEHIVTAARRLEARSVFLSWKHADFAGGSRRRVLDLVDALVAAGLDCWWDQRALPGSPALERLRRDPDLLGSLLDDGLRRARYLLALGSARYGAPSTADPSRNWTHDEWVRARARLTWERWGSPEAWPAGKHLPLSARSGPRRVAGDIAELFDEA